MNFLADVYHLLMRHMRSTRRMPIFLFVAIFQPILWMLLFSQLFRAVTQIPGFESTSYVQFLAPGIAIMSAMFGSVYSGMGLLVDLDRGILDRFLATPVSRNAIVVARVAHTGLTVMLQGLIILIVAMLLGARPHSGVVGIFVVMAAAAGVGSAFGAMSNGLALMVRRQEIFFSVLNFVTMPLTFLSSMIMSSKLMPGWMLSISRFNPLNWGVLVSRNGFEGREWGSTGGHYLMLLGFSAVCCMLAAKAFERYRATL